MIYGIIAMDINIICNLGFEFGLDLISEILLIHLLDCQHSTFEIGFKIQQDPTTSQLLLIRLSKIIS